MTTAKTLLLLTLGITSQAAHATWYTSESDFLAAIASPSYTEDFSDLSFGTVQTPSWDAPGANGYGWTASTDPDQILYSNDSAMSTNFAGTPLIVTFTGLPVNAFGGRLANTDISGSVIPGTVTMTLSSGETESVNVGVAAGEAFLGWVGAATFASVSLTATSDAANNWIQLDHAITGSAVPEPASMAVLGLGLAALKRRRKG